MIHAKGFPGWADFGALIEHIQFIKSHHRKVRRIAAVSDGEFFKIAPTIAKHFVAAEFRQSPFDEMERALEMYQKVEGTPSLATPPLVIRRGAVPRLSNGWFPGAAR
jgi:hypothetical protein